MVMEVPRELYAYNGLALYVVGIGCGRSASAYAIRGIGGGGAVTVMGAVAVTPSDVASIVAVPPDTPVTLTVEGDPPPVPTVATAVFRLRQVTARPMSSDEGVPPKVFAVNDTGVPRSVV